MSSPAHYLVYPCTFPLVQGNIRTKGPRVALELVGDAVVCMDVVELVLVTTIETHVRATIYN